MYIKVVAVSNDIKAAYFSKIDFEVNLFNENCAHLLRIYPLPMISAEIIRNNKDLNKKKKKKENAIIKLPQFEGYSPFYCFCDFRSKFRQKTLKKEEQFDWVIFS